MRRAYLSLSASQVFDASNSELFGELALNLPFAVEPSQRTAWEFEIDHVRQLAAALPNAHFYIEFLIPRMGRRADLIIVNGGIVFVVEYKIGAQQFDRAGLDQVHGYGLDLKYFHEPSHNLPIVPILVATAAEAGENYKLDWQEGLARPLKVRPEALSTVVAEIASLSDQPQIDHEKWIAGRYHPTPTIVEAAQALYSGHQVEEIARSEAGAENLTRTADYIAQAIEAAKRDKRKIICFITGVPGSGKTLAGLNLATGRQRAHVDEHAVFLSGNGPLVDVLREALVLDALDRAEENGVETSRILEERKAAEFIQNIHHFRDDALADPAPPIERVAIFDEAQRAWNLDQTSKFMREKRGQADFSMSEPEFLLGVMDRHPEWCAIICLVGSGQEINTGEAGIGEWLRVLQRSFPHWNTHVPKTLEHDCHFPKTLAAELHLATSIRSFRAEKLSEFVGHVIAGDSEAARLVRTELENFPLLVTRDLQKARDWLRSVRRCNERVGLLASSNAARLKPHGIFVKARIEPAKWFLAPSDDVRSSDALEDAATEFDVQGLELDWTCLTWDANLRRSSAGWEPYRFRGTRWEAISDSARKSYLANSYRVLLTRARQGLIVFVPEGDRDDITRQCDWYDGIFSFLRECGFDVVS